MNHGAETLVFRCENAHCRQVTPLVHVCRQVAWLILWEVKRMVRSGVQMPGQTVLLHVGRRLRGGDLDQGVMVPRLTVLCFHRGEGRQLHSRSVDKHVTRGVD